MGAVGRPNEAVARICGTVRPSDACDDACGATHWASGRGGGGGGGGGAKAVPPLAYTAYALAATAAELCRKNVFKCWRNVASTPGAGGACSSAAPAGGGGGGGNAARLLLSLLLSLLLLLPPVVVHPLELKLKLCGCESGGAAWSRSAPL